MTSKANCATGLAALLPVIAAQASAIEEQRRLPAQLAAALAEQGLFRMLVPRALGGGELTPLDMLDVIEGLATADGSVAWCVMVCATTGMLAAYLDQEAAHEIFGSPAAIVGGVAAPRGTAVASGDGFEIRGRWSWASASAVCTWLMGGFRVEGEVGPPRLAFFPAAHVRLLDDWNPVGLRGTGSGSFEVPAVYVPSRRTSSVLAKPRPGSSPVYAMPPAVMTALCIASVGCGLANAAFDEIGAHIDDAMLGTVTAAWARYRAARALLREQVALAWDKAMSGDALPDVMVAHLRLSAVHAARVSAEECRVLQDAAGGAGVPFSSRLGRCVRDAQTLTAHALVSPRLYRQLGEQLFAAREAA
ncbi:MAG: acyl-CoA dehydrogenase family protein [Sphingomonadales bacterium]|nr:acyl-CoA dehydrogenase family protein [Sphingomonadales bacterium]